MHVAGLRALTEKELGFAVVATQGQYQRRRLSAGILRSPPLAAGLARFTKTGGRTSLSTRKTTIGTAIPDAEAAASSTS